MGIEATENADGAGTSASATAQLSPLKQKLNEIMESMGTATVSFLRDLGLTSKVGFLGVAGWGVEENW